MTTARKSFCLISCLITLILIVSVFPAFADSTVQLTIWEPSNFLEYSSAVTVFEAEHPDVTLHIMTSYDENPMERLTNENLSRDASIDIFVLSTYMLNPEEIFSKGFAEPVTSPMLHDELEKMYPQIRQALTMGETLYGVPAYFSLNLWTYRPELLAKAGYDAPPETMDEYLDMLCDYYQKNADTFPGYRFNSFVPLKQQLIETARMVFSNFVEANWTGEPVSVNAEDFIRWMEKLATLRGLDCSGLEEGYEAVNYQDNATGVVSYEDAKKASMAQPKSIIKDGKATLPYLRNMNPQHQGEVSICEPALHAGDIPKLDASMDYFIINPNSKNKEAAVQFIESYIANMETVEKYSVYPDYTELVEKWSTSAEIQSYQEQIGYAENNIENCHMNISLLENTLKNNTLDENGNWSETHLSLQDDLTYYQTQLQKSTDNLAYLQAKLKEAENDRYTFPLEGINEYHGIAWNMSLKNDYLGWKINDGLDTDQIFERFFDGYLSVDQLIRELDNKLKIFFYEG